ncbi:MAG: pyocin activator PrtN family protein [Woeseia sp.]
MAKDRQRLIGFLTAGRAVTNDDVLIVTPSRTRNTQMSPTYFGLLSEFGESEIPLERVCGKYFGLSVSKAKRRAGLQRLPIPAYRAGSQKSPWLISAADLAKHIDDQRQSASSQWAAMN